MAKSSELQKASKINQRGKLVRFPDSLLHLRVDEKANRQTMLMLWDGNRQIQEYTTDHVFTTVYEQDSFVPVARIVERQAHLQEQAKIAEDKQWQELENYYLGKKHKQRLEHQTQVGIRIYYYHNDHLGTPQELTNALGEVVWLNYSLAWGGSFDKLNNVDNLDGLDVSADELQPIRFQGQFFDGETNLHYNRFRYYDSDVGMFVSRDPIGLMGGDNTFQYAPNPIEWIDPMGLIKATNFGRMPEDKIMPTKKGYQRQHIIPHSLKDHEVFKKSGMNINSATNLMYMPVCQGIDPNPDLGLHRGWTQEHAEYNRIVRGKLDAIQLRSRGKNWDYREYQKEVLNLQKELRDGTKNGKYTCALPIVKKKK